MLKHHPSSRALALALALVSSSVVAFGDTDGYFTTAWGVRAKGMAGLSVSLASDAMTVANNPAGTTRVGRRLDGSLALFSPTRYYSVAGAPTGAGSFMPGSVKSRVDLFTIPELGYVRPLKGGASCGLALYANGGMNTTWPASANGGHGVFGGGQAGVNLEQAFISGSYARKLDANNSLGVSLIFAFQRFSASGIQGFNPGSTKLSDNGPSTSTGVGYRLGWQGKWGPELHVGAIFQPKLNMSRFKKYTGLFAQGGKFDIPATYGFGVSKETAKCTVGAEIKYIAYSKVPAVGNPMANMPNGLGSADGPGFGWRDMTVYKVGAEWKGKHGMTWRSGVSYGRQPIPSSEMLFNLLAPGVMEWHLSGGCSKSLAHNSELSLAFTYSPQKTISGSNPNDPTQTISLKMRQMELAVGYTKKF